MVRLGVRFKSSNYVKGAYSEKAVASYLRLSGWKVKRLWLGGTDLIATKNGRTIKIEVKYSSENKDHKYRATTIKRGCTDHRDSDFIVFVCQPSKSGGACVSFVIPTDIQKDKTFLCVTSHPATYKGYLAQYREAWELLD